MEYELIDFKIRGDERGSLVALESNGEIPFEIKRVYYIFGTARDVVRGCHSHRKLEQIIFCPHGSCDFILDDGKEKKTIHLNKPYQGLHIKNSIWREFTNFSDGCVVMVLASEHYDEADYIRDYNQFLKENISAESNKVI